MKVGKLANQTIKSIKTATNAFNFRNRNKSSRAKKSTVRCRRRRIKIKLRTVVGRNVGTRVLQIEKLTVSIRMSALGSVPDAMTL